MIPYLEAPAEDAPVEVFRWPFTESDSETIANIKPQQPSVRHVITDIDTVEHETPS